MTMTPAGRSMSRAAPGTNGPGPDGRARGWPCDARWLPISVKLRPCLRRPISQRRALEELVHGPRSSQPDSVVVASTPSWRRLVTPTPR